jgi:phosphoribosylamine--glycine ligase
MKVLVIGSGGREHALVWKIAQSPLVEKVYGAPGNSGMASLAERVNLAVSDFEGLADFAEAKAIDLMVVGPEDPLAAGIVDFFQDRGLTVFGPTAGAAQLEGSKAFAKDLMRRYDIPTSDYAQFDTSQEAIAHVREHGAPIVVKADGLAAGKGVTVAQTVDEAVDAIHGIMDERIFGEAGARVIIEECLVGEEASIFAFSDGATILPLVASQDHKQALDGDLGPNTGGMGAYAPAPVITPGLYAEIEATVLQPSVDGLAKDGHPYTGLLYAGLMITDDGPKVIEFNCRFGDPETQVVLPLMASDIIPIMLACCDGTLAEHTVETREGACVSVVMASGGYPKAYEKGKVITGIAEADADADLVVFHAGTQSSDEGLLTNGGRVLGVTALGTDIPSAIAKAYEGVSKIDFDGAQYRSDIGGRALERLKG